MTTVSSWKSEVFMRFVKKVLFGELVTEGGVNLC